MKDWQGAKINLFIWLALIIDCIIIIKLLMFYGSLESDLLNILINFLGFNFVFKILNFLNYINSIFYIFHFFVLIILGNIFWALALNSQQYNHAKAELIGCILKIHLVGILFMAIIALSIFISRL